MAAETREAEIARIEGELALLQSRYDSLKSTTRYILPFCILMGAFVTWFLVRSWMAAEGGAVITAIAILLGLVGLALASRHDRFIVWVSNPGDSSPYLHRSYAEFLESTIADREKRLAELKSKS